MSVQKQLEAIPMKIVLLGDNQAGKTSIRRVLTGETSEEDDSSTGIAYRTLNTIVQRQAGEILIEQEILDIAGTVKPNDQDLSKEFEGVNAFIFVIDATQSLEKSEIVDQINLVRQFSPDAKLYIALNKCDTIGKPINTLDKPVLITSAKEKAEGMQSAKQELKNFVNQRANTTFADNDIFFCSAQIGQNIWELLNQVTGDFCRQRRLGFSNIQSVTPVIESSPSPPKDFLTWIKEQWDQRPPHAKAWIAGNGCLLFGAAALFTLAAFTVGSFLTFGVLPSAFFGAVFIAAGAALVWNIACAIYDEHVTNKPHATFLARHDNPPYFLYDTSHAKRPKPFPGPVLTPGGKSVKDPQVTSKPQTLNLNSNDKLPIPPAQTHNKNPFQ